jgi:hypothetical protein
MKPIVNNGHGFESSGIAGTKAKGRIPYFGFIEGGHLAQGEWERALFKTILSRAFRLNPASTRDSTTK